MTSDDSVAKRILQCKYDCTTVRLQVQGHGVRARP